MVWLQIFDQILKYYWLDSSIYGPINFPGGCVKCPLRALIEGQHSALASLEKTEKCPLWQIFYLVSPKLIINFDLGVQEFSYH